MRSSPFLVLLSVGLLASAMGARAQAMYPGEDVTVNPASASSQILLYPGGEYMRVVPHLREPGQTNGAIHLHMPRKRVARAAPEAPSPEPPARAAPAPKPVTQATTAGPASTASPFDNVPVMSLLPKQPKPTQLAKATPAPAQTAPQSGAKSLVKRSVILFAPGAADPAQSALSAIKFLAGDLNAALSGDNSRIQIQAFGGPRGDKSSDARRLSLNRALAIRQVLIDDGVPAERIDVSAMGGADDGGPLDRVDVYIRA